VLTTANVLARLRQATDRLAGMAWMEYAEGES